MNNFEKRKFLIYLDNLIHITDLFEGSTISRTIETFIKEFKIDKKTFKFDKSGNLRLDTEKQCNEFIATLRKTIHNLQSKITHKNTLLEKQLLILKEIYSLSDKEYEIMVIQTLRDINDAFYGYFKSVMPPIIDNYAQCCMNMNLKQTEQVIKNLSSKNIVIVDRSRRNTINSIEINPQFFKILKNPKFNTQEKIINALVGKPEKTKLKRNDYKHLEKELQKTIKILSSAIEQKKKGVNILLYGAVGTGKTEFAKLAANEANISVFSVLTQAEDFKEPTREDRMIDLLTKQYLLEKFHKGCILLDEGEDIMNRGFSEEGRASKAYLNDILENTPVPVIWTTNNIKHVDPAFLRRMTYAIEFEKLSEEIRLEIWNRSLKKSKLNIDKQKIKEINRSYNISPSLIENAVQTTKMIDGDENDFVDVIESVARVVEKKKNFKLPKKFEMNEYDENLVNADIDVRNLTARIKQSNKLNFSLCLYGEPGTGKSLYARFLAKQLGIEVIHKRVSDLMSMWAGETEQNIADAFAEAKAKKAMLIFDEADSFLQNRNNARVSWEISQVNEMLTWMESHEYPFVCTTNLLDSLDEASLRRFTFKIKFDFLNANQVNQAMAHFFDIKNANVDIKGLTTGDFATVKKKTDFLGVSELNEIVNMLQDEVKLKKAESLKKAVGF